ncbi:MAG: carbon storage regulator CsrA [Deltaproteobacteria bacterium]|nr:carbon storage regulator CsrA [Candidatus Anaeroferrophillus wilburensis]MBN2889613.1 carbon storage regulator CsrA [Deltaproteobacteria bacterium]
MLVLARKTNESINIGDDIVITVVAIEGGVVKLGIEAPKEIPLLRGEVRERITKANLAAAGSEPSWFNGLQQEKIVVSRGTAGSRRPVVTVAAKRQKIDD